MEPDKQPQAVEVARRLNELKALRYDDLLTLPASSSVDVNVGGLPMAVAVWIDKVDGGWLRVVVQAYVRQGGLMGKMLADGFRISASGEITALKNDEIYEFL